MNLTRNILTTLSARILLVGISLVSSMVLSRYLGPEGRGLFALVMLLPGLAGSLGLLGFEQANAVYAGLEPRSQRALVWQSIVIAGLGGSLISFAGASYLYLGAPGLRATLRGPLWLYVIPFAIVPGRLLAEYWLAILRGMNRILLLNLIEVGARVVSLILVLLCIVVLGAGVTGAVWVDAVMGAGMIVSLAALLGHSGILGRPLLDRQVLERTSRFALPAYGASVMTYLNYRIDQFIIAILLPPEQLAFYVIAVDIAEKIWIIPGAVSMALLPHLTNSRDRDPALAAVVARHTIVWTGAGCLLVFAVAGIAVDFLFGAAFDATSTPLRWLLPGIFALAIGKVLVAELLAREKIRFTLWLSLIAASLNAAANFALIPLMGLAGAGLASTLSYSLVSLIVVWYYLRETGVAWSSLVPGRNDVLVYVMLWRRLRIIPVVGPSPI